MVKFIFQRVLLLMLPLCLLVVAFFTNNAYAIFPQTTNDLDLMKDMLQYRLKDDERLKKIILPMLVSIPKHHWQESRNDFASAALVKLQEVFPEPGSFILCVECDTHRVHSRENQQLYIHNGELSLGELADIRKDARYQTAKSLMRIQETPAGVYVLVTSLENGAVLFSGIADSTKTLNDAREWKPFSAEYERRQRGEDLSYVFINLGLFQPLLQIEWVEQFGDRNQHIAGPVISIVNPIAALGVVYHYMLPRHLRLHLGVGLLYPLTEFASAFGDKKNEWSGGVVIQGSAHYTFSSTFGLMLSVNSEGGYSVGMSFYNPILMPFLF